MKRVKVRTLFAALLVASVCGTLFIGSAAAARMTVTVLIVGDEEYRDHAQSALGHFMDWKTLSDFQMTLSQCLFSSTYSVNLCLSTWCEWISATTSNMSLLMEWAKADFNFVSGQSWDIMVILTGQDVSSAGRAWVKKGIVCIFDGWKYIWWGYDYAIDNIIAHEISHLYGAWDHYQYPYQPGYDYCITSNGDAGLSSTVWCTPCHDLIMANRTNYGIKSGAGGGSGRFPLSGGG